MLPILGRLEYLVALRPNLTLNLGAGWGGYVLHSIITSTQSQVYVQNYDPWRPGDVQKNVIRTRLCAVTRGGEVMAGLTFELHRHISLGLSGRMIIISKVKDQWESSGYYATDWDPAVPQLISIREGYEYGGVGWGLGASIRF